LRDGDDSSPSLLVQPVSVRRAQSATAVAVARHRNMKWLVIVSAPIDQSTCYLHLLRFEDH
jgi:hypothetical protein